MNRILTALLVTAALVLPHQITSAEATAQTPDPRVKTALDKLGLKYEIDKDGDFKIVMRTSGNRTQLGWIMSRTQKLGDLEIRQVMSPAYRSSGPLSETIANQLLSDSSHRKLGAWQTLQGKNSYMAVYAAKIAADSSAENLGTSLQVTLFTADEMEKTLTGKDDL